MKITLDISDASLTGLQAVTAAYNTQNGTQISVEEYILLALLEPYGTQAISTKKESILQKLKDVDLEKLEAVSLAVDAALSDSKDVIAKEVK